MKDNEDIKKAVRDRYGAFAESSSSCCGPKSSCGCGSDANEEISEALGYTKEQMNSIPKDANLGLGCGNPVAIASLKPGETVLDLGSGAGFDCFLAANQVGNSGKVIGVDMTPAMLTKARRNAVSGGYENVEFRLGEIENLPAANSSVDVIISNCVINLAPDKARVFVEAYRVLKPGGRFMISDIVLTAPLPDFIRESVQAYVGCISGALLKDDYLSIVEKSGFGDIEILSEKIYSIEELLETPEAEQILKKSGENAQAIGKSVLSITVSARKLSR
jgi:arsenite methyltransferase